MSEERQGAGGEVPRPADGRFEMLLSWSGLLVLVPVVVLLLAALGAFVYGAALFVRSLVDVVQHPFPVGNRIGLFLLVVDLFLIGATMLIASVGFYELFIGRVGTAGRDRRLPDWLVMRDLNDLKVRVIGMIVLVASVSFVEVVVDASRGAEVLETGAGTAVVVLALTAFVRFAGQGHGER